MLYKFLHTQLDQEITLCYSLNVMCLHFVISIMVHGLCLENYCYSLNQEIFVNAKAHRDHDKSMPLDLIRCQNFSSFFQNMVCPVHIRHRLNVLQDLRLSLQ